MDGRPASEDARAWVSSIEAALHDIAAAGDDPDAGLAAAARLARYVDHLLADLVDEARAGQPPLSWARIGEALGVSRQAANERYSGAGRAGAESRRYRRARRLQALRTGDERG